MRKAWATVVLALMALAASLLPAVTNAQGECITNNSQSPRTVNGRLVVEQPLIYPVGEVGATAMHPKFTTFSGYDMWSASLGSKVLSNFVTIKLSGEDVVVIDSYSAGNFELVSGSYTARSGKFYWRPVKSALDIGGGVVAVLDVFEHTIKDRQPSRQELEDAVLLDIAPAFALHLISENGSRVTYVAKAVFVVPSNLLAFMDYVASSGGSIDYITQTTRVYKAQLVVSGSNGGYFNILYMMEYEAAYTLNSTQNQQFFRTILYLHGTFTSQGSVTASYHMLDLTEHNGYILTDVNYYGEPGGGPGSGFRYTSQINIWFKLVNASNPSQAVFDGQATFFMYEDWIGAVGRYRYLNDIILDTSMGGYNVGGDMMLLSLWSDVDGSVFYVVSPSPSSTPLGQAVDLAYVSQSLQDAGYTIVGDGVVSFLPVVWAEKSNGNYTINKAGMAVLFTVRVKDSNDVAGLLVIPRFYGDPQLLSNAPQAYARLLNNGVPYVVLLPETWSQASDNGLTITGWHIMALVEDPNGVFGGTESRLAPILAAGVSLYYSHFVSFDIVDVIMRSQRVNITGIDPGQVFVPVQFPSLGGFEKLLEYMFGGKTWATREDSLPPTWITIPAEAMTPYNTSRNLDVAYMDEEIQEYNYFGMLGTSQYQPPDPASPTMSYNIMFNNIAGTPLLSMNIYGAGGSPQLETLFVTGVIEAPDPTLGKLYADGVSPSIITYAVSVQFQGIPDVPSDIPIPIISNGVLFVSRQGYTWNGIMVVGAVTYVHLDKDLKLNLASPKPQHTSILKVLLGRVLPTVSAAGQPPCDIVMPGIGFCANLTDSPGTAIVELNSYDTLGKLFVLDLSGSARRIIAYYYDPNADVLMNQTICDGDCLEVQDQSPCKAIVIPYTDTSLSPQNRLALVKIVYQQSGGGGGGGGGGAGGIAPPPPGNISLPEHGYVSSPSLTTPKGLMTLALFVAFYVYYNQKMSHAQALVVSTALTGVLSIIIWGPTYLTTILIIFGIGLALYYVLGK